METLIKDTLTLARQGNQASDLELNDLAELVIPCWQNVDAADATLVTETAQEIRADRSRLQQLLANLFSNAVEHGGETVNITVGDLDNQSGSPGPRPVLQEGAGLTS